MALVLKKHVIIKYSRVFEIYNCRFANKKFWKYEIKFG